MIKQLKLEDKENFLALKKMVLDGLEHKDWFVDAATDDGWLTPQHDVLFGKFDGDKLIGVSGLLLDSSFYGELQEALGLQDKKITEMGVSLVLREYRGQNIMYQINKQAIEKAKELGYEKIVATAHPENSASCKSIEKSGFVKKGEIKRKGKYLRNIYLLEI